MISEYQPWVSISHRMVFQCWTNPTGLEELKLPVGHVIFCIFFSIVHKHTKKIWKADKQGCWINWALYSFCSVNKRCKTHRTLGRFYFFQYMWLVQYETCTCANSVILFHDLYLVPSHCLNKMLGYCQLDQIWNKFQWKFTQNTKCFIHQNASENIICEMEAILSEQGDELNDHMLPIRPEVHPIM